MSDILNSRTVQCRVPSIFYKKLSILTKCDLLTDEVSALELALSMMSKAFARDKTDLTGLRANVIFTEDDGFTFVSTDSETLGNHVTFIVLYVKRWRLKGYPLSKLAVIILEELCHCFYRESDERLVQDRVTAAFQTYFPNVGRRDLYLVD